MYAFLVVLVKEDYFKIKKQRNIITLCLSNVCSYQLRLKTICKFTQNPRLKRIYILKNILMQ